MATTFTWDVQNVELIPSHNGNENVVYRVVWSCTATSDAGDKKEQIGVIELDLDAPGDFIPASQVTKQNIINWVKAKVHVDVIEQGLTPTKTVTFLGTDDAGTLLSDQIAAEAAKTDVTPTPD
jgi:hypothetical protein